MKNGIPGCVRHRVFHFFYRFPEAEEMCCGVTAYFILPQYFPEKGSGQGSSNKKKPHPVERMRLNF
jgi:hypothetical protein